MKDLFNKEGKTEEDLDRLELYFEDYPEEHKDNASLISLVEKLYNYLKSAEAYRLEATK